jgi:ketosteroid isomerase-like protein
MGSPSTSRDNIDLVLRAMRAAAQLPKPDVATMNELFAPDHVWVPAALESDDEWIGGAGFRDWRNQLENVLPTQDMRIDGAVDFGPRVVVVAVTTKFGGKASGVPVEQHFWFVMVVRDGKIKRTEAYTDARDATRALATHVQRDA